MYAFDAQQRFELENIQPTDSLISLTILLMSLSD